MELTQNTTSGVRHTATIAESASDSAAIQVGPHGFRGLAVLFPSEWTAADLAVKVSTTEGGTYTLLETQDTDGNAEALVAIVVKGSGRVQIEGGQAFGDQSAGSIFLKSETAYGMSMRDANVNRFKTCLSGPVANNCIIDINKSNRFATYDTLNALTNTVNAVVESLVS